MTKQKQLLIYDHCIACSTCHNVAPTVFGVNGTSAFIIQQPETPQNISKSLEAMKSCPVSAIGIQPS